jgi:hypothetical protein
VAETGRSCWGSGQQDASGSEADAGSRNPGSVTEGDGEGKPVSIESLHSDMHRPLSGLILSLCFYFSMTSLPSQALRASSPKGRAFDDNKKHPQCISIAGVFRLDEYQELSVIISGLPAEPRSS